MPQRNCTKIKAKVVSPNKRITLPIGMEQYQELVGDHRAYREWVDEMITQYPELFPKEVVDGYTLHDERASEKMEGVRLRRICLKACDSESKKQVFTLAPSGVMPYFVGYTDEVEKGLFLRRFDVPFWALAYVFGKDDNYWYRMENRFGCYEIVRTVVKDPEKLPLHLLADRCAKITWLNGEKVVVATTVGEDCILGVSVALNADEENLTEAYQHFKEEALKADYVPETVNTDGWSATQRAWLNLFPLIILIECFLHAFIKIRERGKHLKELFHQLSQQVWDVYRATDTAAFRVKAEELRLWAEKNTTNYVLEAVRKLCAKTERFALAYDHPGAHRTSNMLDRHMNSMSRWLDSARFFHGHWTSAERSVRAWALLHDFGPYCPRSKASQNYSSPAHKLNGFVYHQNWLHNLLISTSMSGCTP